MWKVVVLFCALITGNGPANALCNTSDSVWIYETSSCYWCKEARRFLAAYGVNPISMDATNPQNQRVMMQYARSTGTPVIIVGSQYTGYRGIVGHNPALFVEYLCLR